MKEKLSEPLQVALPPTLMASIKAMAKVRNDSVAETVRALLAAGLRAYGRSKISVG